MRKARRCWTMPKHEALSMLRLIEERIRGSDIRVEHRDMLIRLREMIEDEHIAVDQDAEAAPCSAEADGIQKT